LVNYWSKIDKKKLVKDGPKNCQKTSGEDDYDKDDDEEED
jgi:hypothetical protein